MFILTVRLSFLVFLSLSPLSEASLVCRGALESQESHRKLDPQLRVVTVRPQEVRDRASVGEESQFLLVDDLLLFKKKMTAEGSSNGAQTVLRRPEMKSLYWDSLQKLLWIGFESGAMEAFRLIEDETFRLQWQQELRLDFSIRSIQSTQAGLFILTEKGQLWQMLKSGGLKRVLPTMTFDRLAATPDGHSFLAVPQGSMRNLYWFNDSGLHKSFQYAFAPTDVLATQNSQYFAVSLANGQLAFINAGTGEVLSPVSLQRQDPIRRLFIVDDGEHVMAETGHQLLTLGLFAHRPNVSNP